MTHLLSQNVFIALKGTHFWFLFDFLPVSYDSTVVLCDALRAVYVNVLRWPLDIMVKGLAIFTVNFYGNFIQYLSLPDVETVSILEISGCNLVMLTVFWKTEKPRANFPSAEMVHFLTALVCRFPVGSRYICHTDVINIPYTNNLKRGTLEIQHPNFENSRLGLIVSVHER